MDIPCKLGQREGEIGSKEGLSEQFLGRGYGKMEVFDARQIASDSRLEARRDLAGKDNLIQVSSTCSGIH